MALPADFSKIFGSTATGGLTPIGDVNYAKGWEFVGSNPPTKNDFSYLQNLSDLKSQWLYNNKLQRANPFGDIKSDGTVKTALENLGLGELSIAGVIGGLLTTSGYITIPMIISGARRVLYIQWGEFTGTTDSSGSNGIYETSSITVTWPVAFPNAVFQVITGGSSDVSGVGQQEMAWSLDKTKTNGFFGFQCRTPNAAMTGSYLVIGY